MLLYAEWQQRVEESQALPLFSCIRCQLEGNTSTPITTELQAPCVVVEGVSTGGGLQTFAERPSDGEHHHDIHPLALQR